MNRTREPLIFERSVAGKVGMDLPRLDVPEPRDTRPAHLKRSGFDALPSVTEVDVIRHFTRLSKWNYGVDDGLYPLGSCTMKHNPRINEKVAGLAGFADSHPMADPAQVQGNLALIYTLQEWLKEITGLAAVNLQPSAAAAGELTGVMLIRAFHVAHGRKRRVILLPDSAHGTNPATAAMAGYDVVVVASQADGTVSFEDVTGADVSTVQMTSGLCLGRRCGERPRWRGSKRYMPCAAVLANSWRAPDIGTGRVPPPVANGRCGHTHCPAAQMRSSLQSL